MAYLDECGFSPSQPVGYSWMLPGVRKLVAYEHPRGRRVNAIGVLLPFGESPALWWDEVARSLSAADVLTILAAIPRGPGELVVVLDNASIHRAKLIGDALPRLQEQGIRLYYLPPYCPELNRIEPYFGVIKYTEMPERTYATNDDLKTAIDDAFTACDERLIARTQHLLCPAA